MRKIVLASIAVGTVIGSVGLGLGTASADKGDPMLTWEVDEGLTFHFGDNVIEPYPGSQSCYFRIDRGSNGRMYDLVGSGSGKPQQPLSGTITGPTTLSLATEDKLTSDCYPSILG
ncbi:hypothetical protein ACWIGI_25685 [Nocardia sp. NPDC055321]